MLVFSDKLIIPPASTCGLSSGLALSVYIYTPKYYVCLEIEMFSALENKGLLVCGLVFVGVCTRLWRLSV